MLMLYLCKNLQSLPTGPYNFYKNADNTMEMIETKKRTRTELLEMIQAAKAELESLNKWKVGNRVLATGTVERYIDDEGTVAITIDGCEGAIMLNEDSLLSASDKDSSVPSSRIERKLQDITDRCKAILGASLQDDSPFAAIEAVVNMMEHSNVGNGRSQESPYQNGSSLQKSSATRDQYYTIVRRETGRPNTRFDLTGREYFHGYLTKDDCEAYRKDCEDRESSWGVRGEVYRVLPFHIAPVIED